MNVTQAGSSEFDGKNFPLIDGSTRVSTADWDKWIEKIDSKVGVTLNKRTTIRRPRQHRIVRIEFGPWTVPFADATSVPTDEPSQLQDLETHLQTDPRFQTTHLFRKWQRQGFADLNAFIAGYKGKQCPARVQS